MSLVESAAHVSGSDEAAVSGVCTLSSLTDSAACRRNHNFFPLTLHGWTESGEVTSTVDVAEDEDVTSGDEAR